ncbi:MAG: nucleotide pyrophosphatase, partial [Halobacteria archaeon]|nr:nucleotide pyrophosphatase [Halobacteria archaeon]
MGDTSTTVVLGWDGLDYEIGSEFGLLDDFVPHHKKIDTFDNPVLGNPSTYEIWPTIITGVEPARHGVRVISDDEGAGISNPVVGRLSNTLHSLLPERTRVGIGLALRNRGISLDQRSPKYYRSKGFTTVFDGRRSRSVGVPNYRTRMDDELDVVSGWGPKMSRHLNIEANEETNQVVYHPETSSERVEEWLVGETELSVVVKGVL